MESSVARSIQLDQLQMHLARSNWPPMDFDISTPASRGLYDECARYNWRYHLTRYLGDEPKDALPIYEDAPVKDILERHGADPSLAMPDHTVEVTNKLYGGPYQYSNRPFGHALWWQWDSRTIPNDLQRRCSFCSLLGSIARAADVTLPLVSSIQCNFDFVLENHADGYYPAALGIIFGATDLKQAYPYGTSMSLPRIRHDVVAARKSLNPNKIDLAMVQRRYKDCTR
jgi:hypothetical protein